MTDTIAAGGDDDRALVVQSFAAMSDTPLADAVARLERLLAMSSKTVTAQRTALDQQEAVIDQQQAVIDAQRTLMTKLCPNTTKES